MQSLFDKTLLFGLYPHHHQTSPTSAQHQLCCIILKDSLPVEDVSSNSLNPVTCSHSIFVTHIHCKVLNSLLLAVLYFLFEIKNVIERDFPHFIYYVIQSLNMKVETYIFTAVGMIFVCIAFMNTYFSFLSLSTF